MKVIKPSHEVFSREEMTPYQFIEKIGRTCYKSEDKITDDSAVKFVEGLYKRKHYAMLEHYMVHLIYKGDYEELIHQLNEYAQKYCSKLGAGIFDIINFFHITSVQSIPLVHAKNLQDTYISVSLRTLIEIAELGVKGSLENYKIPPLVDEMFSCVFNYFKELTPYPFSYRYTRNFELVLSEDSFILNLQSDLNRTLGGCSGCEKSWLSKNCQECTDIEDIRREIRKHKTYTVKLVCDRGVSHEIVRHRPCSFGQESTRYCNYSLGKFGGELTFILPPFFEVGSDARSIWEAVNTLIEVKYFELIAMGVKPEEARSILPNSLKTEIIVTATEEEWQHIFNLRVHGTTGKPHPQIKEVLEPFYNQIKDKAEGRIK